MADGQERRIKIEFTGVAARITLTHPPLNVIDVPMMLELKAALDQIENIPEVMAVVIAGGERAFSAGVDIGAHDPAAADEMLRDFHGVIRSMVASQKLLIASVRRHCLGGGAELALMCDLIYASNDAVIGFPEIKLAAFPPVAMVALAACVGQKRAAELVLTAKSVTADEALQMGLVNGIADDPETLVTECLSRVQQMSPVVLRLAKKAFYAWDAVHFDKGLAKAEKIYSEELLMTDDAHEGVRAYVEKRRPKWTGR